MKVILTIEIAFDRVDIIFGLKPIYILLPWLSSNLTSYLGVFITDEGIARIFFLKCILKLLNFLRKGIVVLMKWPTLVCLQICSLGGIACLTYLKLFQSQ
jgi:hypothetical protein